MSAYHLAQLNIGIIRAPMDSPIMAEFANNLDRVNAIADGAPGFVWRLQTDEGNATSIRPFENENLLLNMSVWRDVDSLRVGRHEGRFRKLMIRATDSSFRMHDIRIVFTDGTVYSPRTELRFSQGETQTLDLPGNTRAIKRIDFRYSDTRQRDTAVVEVWGR